MQIVRFVARAYSPLPQWGELVRDTVYATSGPGLVRTGPHWRRSSVELLIPVTPSKIVCVGRNYAAHAQELGNEVPKEPGIFLKAPNTLALYGEVVPYPSFTEALQFEGELAVVMVKRAKDVQRERAMEYILGYTCALDLTARDRQRTDLQWTRAKSSDKFCPIGPWIETTLDLQHAWLETRVNGAVRQRAPLSDMIFSVPEIIEYISSFMTLEPGDVILTGTPEGVGALAKGDQVEVEVEGLAVLRTSIGD